jgi:hypothetical protein
MDHRIRAKVGAALKEARKLLDTTRSPVLPADAPHTYGNKYDLAERAVTTMAGAQVALMEEAAPRWSQHVPQMQAWAKEGKTVTMRFESVTACDFIRTATRKEESPSVVRESSSSLFGTSKSSTKVVRTVIEHFWKQSATWKLTVYAGGDATANSLVLLDRVGTCELKTVGTEGRDPSAPNRGSAASSEMSLSWLLARFEAAGGLAVGFSIDRDVASCRTPVENDDTRAALAWLQQARSFWSSANSCLRSATNYGAPDRKQLGAQNGNLNGVFDINSAVFCLDESDAAPGAVAGRGVLLSDADVGGFLAHYKQSFARAVASGAFPPAPGTAGAPCLATTVEATLYAVCVASERALAAAGECLRAIEAMLQDQIVAAVGKHLEQKDFDEYMEFHNRRLFQPEYRPRPFSFAVRRPGGAPCGSVSITAASGGGGGADLPIKTMVLRSDGDEVAPMKFALSASANVEILGERYLHATVLTSFNGHIPRLTLEARARQFGSYVLLVGKLAAADTFDPVAAIVIANKDELNIPLMLETVPTPKEFRDAIDSLSPEQQAFCKAYRGMQLASSVFALAVIQIQPQLERVLNLDDGALTKEIALNRELMEFFTTYQVGVFSLFTVTFYANHAHNLTRSPSHL